MQRPAPGTMPDLLATAGSGGTDDIVLPRFAHGRKQPVLTDAHGQVKVLRLIPERARHTAAARVDLGYTIVGWQREGCDGEIHPLQCFLVAVAMKMDTARIPGHRDPEAIVCGKAGNKLVEQNSDIRNGRHTRVTREQGRIFVAERQYT